MALDSQCTKFNIVINLPVNTQFLLLNKACNELFKEWSYIKHDKDRKDNGCLKTIHYHLVAKTNKRVRIATIINKLSELLNIDTMLITCKKCISYVGAIQYLIHKNDVDKYQYDRSLIDSSISPQDIDLILDSDNDTITMDTLVYAVKNCRNLAEVMQFIGLQHYVGYRNVIKDLWSCKYEL